MFTDCSSSSILSPSRYPILYCMTRWYCCSAPLQTEQTPSAQQRSRNSTAHPPQCLHRQAERRRDWSGRTSKRISKQSQQPPPTAPPAPSSSTRPVTYCTRPTSRQRRGPPATLQEMAHLRKRVEQLNSLQDLNMHPRSRLEPLKKQRPPTRSWSTPITWDASYPCLPQSDGQLGSQSPNRPARIRVFSRSALADLFMIK
jgi:hypothetical protein